MRKQIIIAVVVLFIIALFIFIVIIYYRSHSLEYQLRMLKEGNGDQKVAATFFMERNKVVEAIPLLMIYIDSKEVGFYKKPPYYMSCSSTGSLDQIVNKGFGNTCNMGNTKTEEQIEQIKEKWRNWYKNEYPEWIENYYKEHYSSQ